MYKTLKLQTNISNKFFEIIYFIIGVSAMPTILHSSLRCHFFTFLFFSIFLYILELVRKNNNYKLLALLPFIMLFWCNIHGGCVSGLGLLFIYSIGEFLNKKPFKWYLITLFCSFIVMFINPYGFDYIKFIFMASLMKRPFVTEWISPFLHPNINFMLMFKLFYIFNFIFFSFSLKKLKTDYTKYILMLGCAYLSFKYVKNTPFFIITSIIFLYDTIFAQLININFFKKFEKLLFFITILVALIFSVNEYLKVKNYSYISLQPVKVVEFIKLNELKGNILAPFDMGSYIVYKLFPNNLIYMDGRYEEVYFDKSKELLDNFYNVQNDWWKILETNPDFIIVPTNALLNDYLAQNKNYKIIYQDDDNILYSKIELVKNMYKIPLNTENLKEDYIFKTQFKFTDDIVINGKKVIFN
jgi:hypothetical protein